MSADGNKLSEPRIVALLREREKRRKLVKEIEKEQLVSKEEIKRVWSSGAKGEIVQRKRGVINCVICCC